jgi:glycosyltransferase 2 family protein
VSERGSFIQNNLPPRPSTPSSSGRRLLRIGLRAAIGILIVVFLLSRTNIHRLMDSLSHTRPGDVAMAFALLLLGLVVNAFRWQLFLRPLGLGLAAATLIRLTFVGTFFNAFLPTGFGGDAYKSFHLRGHLPDESASMSPPLATVFLDRLAGLVGLALLGLGGSVVRLIAGDHGGVTLAASLSSVGVLVASGAALVLAPRWGGSTSGSSRMAARLRVFAQAFATAGREAQALRWGVVVGIVSALLLVAVNALLAASLGISVPGAALPGIVLIASLMTIVPLSINGLGFRESAYVWCLAAYGIGRDEALAFAVLVLAVTLASCAVGGVVYAVAGGQVTRRT